MFGVFALFGCVILPILAAVLLPVFFSARAKAQQSSCLNHLKSLGVSQGMYSVDFDDTMPIATWMDAIAPYVKDESYFHCPSVDQGRNKRYGYSMTDSIVGKNLAEILDIPNTIVFFDSTPMGRNALSDVTSLPDPPRHSKNCAVFGDGRVKTLP